MYDAGIGEDDAAEAFSLGRSCSDARDPRDGEETTLASLSSYSVWCADDFGSIDSWLIQSCLTKTT